MSTAIVLATLNARYTHAGLGLRYLRANLGAMREQSVLCEFTIKRPCEEIVAEILALNPRVVGFGVYIWNTEQTLAVVRRLKQERPSLLVVLGGPEISYEIESQDLYSAADFIFAGEADFAFRDFIERWFERGELPDAKVVRAELPEIKQLCMPYAEYSDEDLRHRTIYVEASRGCPYKCEYCLSSLDKSVRNFPIAEFLREMQMLLDRGLRQFKFVDRTFNLAPSISAQILRFFLQRVDLGLFLHFEMVPDRLPDELKDLIAQFPRASLQFEIGIQTWSPAVGRNVSRRQDYSKIADNFAFLRSSTGVHTHADLIVGLPGETWESFAFGFNALYELHPDEIQVGLLKRLKGTPIVRHDSEFQMLYGQAPPFAVISTRDLRADEISRLKIFADFWDLVANSGRFPGLREACARSCAQPFDFYLEMADWLYAHFGRTHSIHLRDLEAALRIYWEAKGWVAVLSAARVSEKHGVPYRQALHVGS